MQMPTIHESNHTVTKRIHDGNSEANKQLTKSKVILWVSSSASNGLDIAHDDL